MLLPGGDQRQKAVVPVIRSRLRTALWARADILNPILLRSSRCRNSLRAGIIDSLATGPRRREAAGVCNCCGRSISKEAWFEEARCRSWAKRQRRG